MLLSFDNPDLNLDEATTSVNTLEAHYLASLDGGRTATAALNASEVIATTSGYWQGMQAEWQMVTKVLF